MDDASFWLSFVLVATICFLIANFISAEFVIRFMLTLAF
jgi:hypothetical protein